MPVDQVNGGRRSGRRPLQPAWQRNLVLVDLGASTTAWLAVALLIEASLLEAFLVGAAGVVVTMAMIAWQSLYHEAVWSVFAREIRAVTLAALLGAVAALATEFVVWRDAHVMRSIVAAGLAAALLIIGRIAFDLWLRSARAQGLWLRRTVIVGDGPNLAALRELVDSQPDLGVRLVGHIGASPSLEPGVPWLGSTSAGLDSVCWEGIDEAIVVAGAGEVSAFNRVLRDLLERGVPVRMFTGLARFDRDRLAFSPLAHEPLLYLSPPHRGLYQRRGKRALGLGLGCVFLGLAAPVMVAVAIAIKLDDHGPVFYRQQRIGLHGVAFHIVKFRTMRVGADTELALMAKDNFREGPLFKLRDDPRVTRVGRVLRATKLDELPQLLNVVAGTMALVGPRPALPSEVAQFDADLLGRNEVRPGITGLWQIEGRDSASFYAYRHLDLFYVENWSLILDLWIVLATVVVIHARLLSALLAVLRGGTDRRSMSRASGKPPVRSPT